MEDTQYWQQATADIYDPKRAMMNHKFASRHNLKGIPMTGVANLITFIAIEQWETGQSMWARPMHALCWASDEIFGLYVHFARIFPEDLQHDRAAYGLFTCFRRGWLGVSKNGNQCSKRNFGSLRVYRENDRTTAAPCPVFSN